MLHPSPSPRAQDLQQGEHLEKSLPLSPPTVPQSQLKDFTGGNKQAIKQRPPGSEQISN